MTKNRTVVSISFKHVSYLFFLFKRVIDDIYPTSKRFMFIILVQYFICNRNICQHETCTKETKQLMTYKSIIAVLHILVTIHTTAITMTQSSDSHTRTSRSLVYTLIRNVSAKRMIKAMVILVNKCDCL